MDGVAWKEGGDAYVSCTWRWGVEGNDSPGDWKPGGRIGEEKKQDSVSVWGRKTQNRGADSFLPSRPRWERLSSFALRDKSGEGGGGDLFIQVDSSGALWMIKGVCLPRLCVHPLSACQSGLKVVVYRTNMCVLESANERRERLHVALIPFVWGLVPPYVRLIAAIKRRASALTLKDKEDKKKSPHQNTRDRIFFIHCRPTKPTSEAAE